jgi:hypothetical protein
LCMCFSSYFFHGRQPHSITCGKPIERCGGHVAMVGATTL